MNIIKKIIVGIAAFITVVVSEISNSIIRTLDWTVTSIYVSDETCMICGKHAHVTHENPLCESCFLLHACDDDCEDDYDDDSMSHMLPNINTDIMYR